MLICCCDTIEDLGCFENCSPVVLIEEADKGLYIVKWEFGGVVYSQSIQTEAGEDLVMEGLQVGTHTVQVEFDGDITCYRVRVERSAPHYPTELETIKTIIACG